MPVVIAGERIPKLLSRKHERHASELTQDLKAQAEQIRIALINNMPDAALEDTELQFFELLHDASGDLAVSLKFFSLPNLPRNGLGQTHLQNYYSDIRDLLSVRFDGVIMTGTEPCQSSLRDEPFWPILTEVLEWAERCTSSAILSCLAAHAGVLHSDGVSRHRLSDKQFGLFEYEVRQGHRITDGVGNTIQIPHSRWNEVRADALVSCGYDVLTQSAIGGVDLFAKKKRNSLFLHFQGHPEYGPRTLLKEYRRDIKRFLRQERETYPTMPRRYFDAHATKILSEFQKIATANRTEALIEKFPEGEMAGRIRSKWHTSAKIIYRNWLQYLATSKANASASSAMTSAARI
jgi:homoserine O-succinyltransferase/O-acetyltransferase